MMNTKQKKIRLRDVKVGLKVVVNDLPDTVVYTIKQVHGFTVELVYTVKGVTIDGGWIDYGSLLVPTEEQMKANGL